MGSYLDPPGTAFFAPNLHHLLPIFRFFPIIFCPVSFQSYFPYSSLFSILYCWKTRGVLKGRERYEKWEWCVWKSEDWDENLLLIIIVEEPRVFKRVWILMWSYLYRPGAFTWGAAQRLFCSDYSGLSFAPFLYNLLRIFPIIQACLFIWISFVISM